MKKSTHKEAFMSTMLKRAAAILLVAVLVLAGCSGAGEDSGTTEGGQNAASGGEPASSGSVLSFGCFNDPMTFGPWDGGGAGRGMANMAFYEPLAYLQSDGSFSYCIMKEYTNPSDKVYDITIYDYVHDSQGNPVTADDVVFSIQTCIELGTQASYTSCIESVTKTGEYSLEIVLNSEVPDSFANIASNVMIVSQVSYEESGNGMSTKPIGTGSYVLGDYVGGTKIVCIENPDYWQTEEALVATQSHHELDSYEITIITEKSQHSIALETGQIAATNSILSADFVNFLDDDGNAKDGYGFIESQPIKLAVLYFNCREDSVCNDENLRKAIAYCIDRAGLAYAGYGASGYAPDGLSIPAMMDYDESFVPEGGYFQADLEKAREYLAASDYQGQEIQLVSSNETEFASMAEIIRSYCEEAGITVKVNTYDSSIYDSIQYGLTDEYKWDMIFGMVSGGNYTYSMFNVSLNADNFTTGVNICGVYDEELQSRINTAMTMSTFSTESTKAVLDYITDRCYAVAMAGNTAKVFYRTDMIDVLGVTNDNFNPCPGLTIAK